MEWFIVIVVLIIAFIPPIYRMNKRIYKLEQKISDNRFRSRQR